MPSMSSMRTPGSPLWNSVITAGIIAQARMLPMATLSTPAPPLEASPTRRTSSVRACSCSEA